MSKYLITGGSKLSGTLKISGNKNSVLPCLAASILTAEEVILQNVPEIADVEVFLEILRSLGAEISKKEEEVRINASSLKAIDLPEELVKKLRASVLLAGPLLAKHSKVRFPHPGGDVIGKRTINTHLQGFKLLGYKVKVADLEYSIAGQKCDEDCTIFLDEASCTATENVLMASVLGNTTIILKNCAQEPQIIDLCNFLIGMGASIKGIGTTTLVVAGVKKLHGTTFKISPDYIEMGTYAIAAAITKGELKLTNCSLKGIEPVIKTLEKMGVIFEEDPKGVLVSGGKLSSIPKLITNIWPGFPTDLMSAVIVLATQGRGVSLLHDWMYESRMFFADKLISMGANITIADPHRVFVYGPTKLQSRDLETPDIRAGMALVLASLVAKGQSSINRAELIERGYGDVAAKLSSLGADIQRVD